MTLGRFELQGVYGDPRTLQGTKGDILCCLSDDFIDKRWGTSWLAGHLLNVILAVTHNVLMKYELTSSFIPSKC